MLRPYRSTNPRDNCVHFLDPTVMEVPDNLLQARRTFHVTEVAKENSDYTVNNMGQKTYFKFTSSEGRQHFKTNGSLPRVTIIGAVTNYECLVALGREDLIELYELPSDAKKNSGDNPNSSQSKNDVESLSSVDEQILH